MSKFVISVLFTVIICCTGQQTGLGGMPGGWTDHGSNHPQAWKWAWVANPAVNQAVDSTFAVIPRLILSYRTQVVAGSNHAVDLIAMETGCPKKQASSGYVQLCYPSSSGAQYKCSVVVFSQPWTGTQEVKSVNCKKI